MDTHDNKVKTKSKKESTVHFLDCMLTKAIFDRLNVEYCTTIYRIPFLIWNVPSHHRGF